MKALAALTALLCLAACGEQAPPAQGGGSKAADVPAVVKSKTVPAAFQGVPFRSTGEPIAYLTPPKGVTGSQQRARLDLLQRWNAEYAEANPAESALAARIASYELAFRMQTDFRKHSGEVNDTSHLIVRAEKSGNHWHTPSMTRTLPARTKNRALKRTRPRESPHASASDIPCFWLSRNSAALIRSRFFRKNAAPSTAQKTLQANPASEASRATSFGTSVIAGINIMNRFSRTPMPLMETGIELRPSMTGIAVSTEPRLACPPTAIKPHQKEAKNVNTITKEATRPARVSFQFLRYVS